MPKTQTNKRMRLRHLAGLLVIFSSSGLVAAPVEIFVSPSGNDSNDGHTQTSAVLTLTRVQELIRGMNPAPSDNVIVEMGAGDYVLPETLTFSKADSGQNGHLVVYRSAGGIGNARLLGGSKVVGWELWKDGIYRAKIGGDLSFSTLYENGIRADLARWPKRTSPFATSRAGYLTLVDDRGGTGEYVDNAERPDGVNCDLSRVNLDKAWVYFWDGGDGHRWSSGCKPVKLKAPVTNTMIPSQNGGYGSVCNSFLIEGSLDLLSQPGEFFYDSNEGYVYYKSRFPGDIHQQEILVPKLMRLVGIEGKSSDEPVRDLVFDGVTFACTDRIQSGGTADWTDSQQSSWDGAIYAKNAEGIAFRNCHFVDVGICGITLDCGTKKCTVDGCLIEHTGYHGVSLINGEENQVSDCLIRNVGELRGHGDGVSIMNNGKPDPGSNSPKFCSHLLSHLEIYDSPRAGVAIRGLNDRVEYVKVHDCVQDSGDQGAIYLVDPALNCTLNQCTSFHNYCDLSNMDRPPTAVYNDRDATNTVWSNIDAGDSQMFVFRHDPQKKGTLTFENVSWDPKCTPSHNEVAGPLNPNFDKSKMEYDKIGLLPSFPAVYNDSLKAPVAPLNIWAEAGSDSVRLHWTEADRATRYEIWRSSVAGGPYVMVGASAVPATGWDQGTSYTDAHLQNDATYFYVIKSINGAGASPASVEVRAVPNAKGCEPLAGIPIGAGGDFGKAFDGNLATAFESGNGWAGLDLGSPFIITKIYYSPVSRDTGTTARMCRGEFQGAETPDFANPVTLFKVLGTKGGAGTPVLIPQRISVDTAFRYIRFVGPNHSTLVAEIEFYGHSATH